MYTNYEEERQTTVDKNRLTLIVKGVNICCVNFADIWYGGMGGLSSRQRIENWLLKCYREAK